MIQSRRRSSVLSAVAGLAARMIAVVGTAAIVLPCDTALAVDPADPAGGACTVQPSPAQGVSPHETSKPWSNRPFGYVPAFTPNGGSFVCNEPIYFGIVNQPLNFGTGEPEIDPGMYPDGIAPVGMKFDTDPLPAQQPIFTSASFNGQQTDSGCFGAVKDAVNSNGIQGYNWFQDSRPELTLQLITPNTKTAGDILYITTSATDGLLFVREANDGNTFVGVNGNATVVEYNPRNTGDAGDLIDTYDHHDRSGRITTFAGYDARTPADHGGVAGQMLRVVDANGGTGSASAHAGNSTTYSEANALGAFVISTGTTRTSRVSTMFDSAGRRYTYSYSGSAIGGAIRLTGIDVERYESSTWKMTTKAEYDYYTADTVITGGPKDEWIGVAGDLKSITTTTYLSLDKDDLDVTVERTRYFRYYCEHDEEGVENDIVYDAEDNPGHAHQIKLVLEAEGYRHAIVDKDLDTDYSDELRSYASLYATYESDTVTRRLQTLMRNGECGCGGAGSPNGTYTFAYIENPDFNNSGSDYDCAGQDVSDDQWDDTKWARRTTVERPDGSYRIFYFDEFGQVLAHVTTDSDPTLELQGLFWVTRFERDEKGRVVKVFTPEAIGTYVYSNDGDTDDMNYHEDAGLVGHLTYFSGTHVEKLGGNVVVQTGHSKGQDGDIIVDSQTAYQTSGTDWFYNTQGTANMGMPLVISSKVFKNEIESTDGTGLANAANSDTTTNAYTFWGNFVVQSVVTTAPTVSTGTHGSNSATTTARYLTYDGRVVLSKDQDGRYNFFEYDSTTMQLTQQTQDAEDCASCPLDTAGTAYSISTFPSPAFDLVTSYTYDPQGRPTTVTLPNGRVTYSYYTKLADGRIVALSGPKKVSTNYYGPVSYSVSNHGGRTELSGVLALESATETSIALWIDTTESDFVTAVDTDYATVERVAETVYDLSGSRVLASRQYFDISSPLSSATGADYDETLYGHDDMGRIWRAKDPTGTITRTVFDKLGRVVERWMGTNDNDFAGGESSPTDNMTKVEERRYDGVFLLTGNSNLTEVIHDADGNWGGAGDQRVTAYTYDYRNRPFLTENPESPHSLVKYDNRNRVVAAATYSDVTGFDETTDPVTEDTDRLSLSQTYFDERGQVWKTEQFRIDQSDGSTVGSPEEALVDLRWYDSVGRLIKTAGTSVMKYKYDTLGRQTRAYTLAQVNDSETYMPAQSGYEQAAHLDDDIVLEESQTLYDDPTSNVLATIHLQRHHDKVGTPEGALDVNGDTNDLVLDDADLKTSSNVHARAQITAMWYDALDRPTDTVHLGTYGLNEGGGPTGFNRYSGMSSPPSRSDAELRTTTTYDKDGTVLEVTDPRGLITRYLYDDAGRQVAVISNYVDGTPSGATGDDDNIVRYEYDKGLMVKMWVDLDGQNDEDSDDQVTEYVYGTSKGTLGTGSPVVSQIATGHLLREAIYPPQVSMQSAADRTVHSAYNALSEPVWTKNQNGTIIITTIDNAGRQTARTASAYGTGVGDWVERVELTYTDRGQVEDVTQYDDNDAELNGVKYTYDDWGNIGLIEQDRDSKVGTAMTDDPYEVAFTYALNDPAGGRHRVQRETMLLPYPSTGYEVGYLYEGGTSSPTSLDELTGRVTGFVLNGAGTKRVTYQYLGAGDLVGTTYPEFASTVGSYRHTNVTNAAYDAFDRFNRVVIDRWAASAGTPYRLNLQYDRNSNITWAEDPVIVNGSSGGMSPTLYKPYTTKYTMDGLDRVTTSDRGRPSGGSVIGDIRLNELWTLTQTGNWDLSTRKIDSDGNVTDSNVPGVWNIDEFQDDRTHNTVNEIDDRVLTGALASATYSAAYDKAGQMIDDGKDRGFQYDAFGRLVEVRKVTGRTMGGAIDTYTVMAEYRYDGLGQRIAWHRDFDGSGNVNAHSPYSADPWIHIVYDDRWRMVALFNAGDPVDEPKELLIPHNAGFNGHGGSSYIDTYAVSEFDGDGRTGSLANTSDGSLQTRRYYLQNWRADVVTLIDTASAFAGWYKYSAYGQHQWISTGDIDNGLGDGFREGSVDINDLLAFLSWFGGGDMRLDQNGDGGVDINDSGVFGAGYDLGGPQDSRVMYAGYAFDPLDDNANGGGQYGLHHVRHRVYSPELGRWTRRDPLGYVDGTSLFIYVRSQVLLLRDPSGLHPGDRCWDIPDAEFWEWYHREYKQPGDLDIQTREEAWELYEEWKSRGRPSPERYKHKWKQKRPFMPEDYIDLPSEQDPINITLPKTPNIWEIIHPQTYPIVNIPNVYPQTYPTHPLIPLDRVPDVWDPYGLRYPFPTPATDPFIRLPLVNPGYRPDPDRINWPDAEPPPWVPALIVIPLLPLVPEIAPIVVPFLPRLVPHLPRIIPIFA